MVKEINNEYSECAEHSDISKDILELKGSIKKDFDKFNTLSNNPEVQKWLSKILDKSASEKFSKKWEDFEKINVSNYMNDICKKYPSLLLLKQNLWLSDIWKFSTMSTKSKLAFMALYEANQKETDYKSVMEKYKQYMKSYTESMNQSFKWKNISNFLVLEKTLIKDFWLTESESKKVSEYLQIIKKHPSYVWLNEYQEAKDLRGYVVVSIIAWALWALWLYSIEHTWWTNYLILKDWEYSYTDEKEILQVLSYEAAVSQQNCITIPVFDDKSGSWLLGWTARAIGFDSLWNFADEIANGTKNLGNKALSKEMVITILAKAKMSFDINKNSRIDYNVYKDNTGCSVIDVSVVLPEPDIIITDDKLKYDSSSFEWIHFQKFEEETETARQEIIQILKEKTLTNKDFYDKSIISIKKTVKAWFESAYKPLQNELWSPIVKIWNINVTIGSDNQNNLNLNLGR